MAPSQSGDTPEGAGTAPEGAGRRTRHELAHALPAERRRRFPSRDAVPVGAAVWGGGRAVRPLTDARLRSRPAEGAAFRAPCGGGRDGAPWSPCTLSLWVGGKAFRGDDLWAAGGEYLSPGL